jgi:hypothetical protein
VRRNVRQRRVDSLLLEDGEHHLIASVVDRRRLVHQPDPGDRLFVRQSLLKIDDVPRRTDNRERGDDREPDDEGTHELRTTFGKLGPVASKCMNSVVKLPSQLMHSHSNVRHGRLPLQQVIHDEDVSEHVAFTLLD